jgi:hypothetical protein
MARLAGTAKIIEAVELPSGLGSDLEAAGLSKSAADEVIEIIRSHVITHRLMASYPRANRQTRNKFSSVAKSADKLLQGLRDLNADADRNEILERNLRHWHTELTSVLTDLHSLEAAVQRAIAEMPEDRGGAALPALEGFVARLIGVYENDTGRAAGRSFNVVTEAYGGPFFRLLQISLAALPTDVTGGSRSGEAVALLIREAMEITRQ